MQGFLFIRNNKSNNKKKFASFIYSLSPIDGHLQIIDAIQFKRLLLISPMFTPVFGMLGTTFGGNHLACVAAIAVLEIMAKEKSVENAK